MREAQKAREIPTFLQGNSPGSVPKGQMYSCEKLYYLPDLAVELHPQYDAKKPYLFFVHFYKTLILRSYFRNKIILKYGC